jgi:hypothetical protein
MDTASLHERLPPPAEICRRIDLCREEISELKKLLKLSAAAHRADEVRAQRRATATPQQEVRRDE